MCRRLKGKAGFTLIEILIVIIVLGILAMIIVPQITVSTDDAKVSTLQSDLSALRSAVEIYYAQHGNRYPGMTDSAGATNTAAAAAAVAMVAQMTRYTDADGDVNAVKNTTFKYGPYIKGNTLPANPFNTTANSSAVVCSDSASINAARSVTAGGAGWKFHFKTGILYANDAVTVRRNY
jgi:type II secretion system protein G